LNDFDAVTMSRARITVALPAALVFGGNTIPRQFSTVTFTPFDFKVGASTPLIAVAEVTARIRSVPAFT
jgi:hypothetical protein